MEINKKLVNSLNNLVGKDREKQASPTGRLEDHKHDLARRLKNKIIARKENSHATNYDERFREH